MSPISSIKSVPPCASSSAPALRACSPLDCSIPNSSTSMRSGVIAAALMTTKGPSARPDALCSVRAANSLPAPEGPTIRIRLLALAARSMVWRSWFMQAERPVRTLAAGASCLSSLTSRFRREVCSARGFDIAVPGDHHDRQIGVIPLYLLQQLQPIELAALQPDVEKHQVRAAIGNFRQRRIAVARGPRAKTLVVENARNQIANIGL